VETGRSGWGVTGHLDANHGRRPRKTAARNHTL